MAGEAESNHVRAALEELLNWEDLQRSPQLAEFLKYIVEAKLAGDEASIKAYAIAVDVFGRPADFDPQTDPIVRVQGGRLRGLLNRFYDANLNTVPLQIRIPVGRYVPDFVPVVPGESSGDGGRPTKRTQGAQGEVTSKEVQQEGQMVPIGVGSSGFLLGGRIVRRRLALFSAAIAFGAILTWITIAIWLPTSGNVEENLQAIPTEPAISVDAFSNLTGIATLDEPVAGLGLQLVTDLSRFSDLSIRNRLPDGVQQSLIPGREYELSGVVRRGSFGVEFNMLLTNRADREIVWTTSLSEPSLAGDHQLLIGRISRLAAGAIGSHRGPVHARQRQWVIANGENLPAVSEYICRLLLSVARDDPTVRNREAAGRCFEELLAQDGRSAIVLAGSAGTRALEVYAESAPDQSRAVLLRDALADARAAAEAFSYSSFVRAQLARVHSVAGNWDAARQEYVAALQRNPADSDLRGEFALLLAIGGEWQAGGAQMELALASAPTPPSWFYLLGTMRNLIEGDYDSAYEDSQSLVLGSEEWGDALALTAAQLSGHLEAVERLRPQVLENEHYQAYGILPWLKRDTDDEILLGVIERGLQQAGLPGKIIQGSHN